MNVTERKVYTGNINEKGAPVETLYPQRLEKESLPLRVVAIEKSYQHYDFAQIHAGSTIATCSSKREQ